MDKFELKIETLNKVQENMLLVECSRQDGEKIKAKAGQFFMFFFDEDKDPFNRSYSIANAIDGEMERVEFIISPSKSGKSYSKINAWKEGDLVKATGPHGRFRLKGNEENLVAIATGTGIAPFRAMLPSFVEKMEKGDKVTIIHGARCESEAIYSDELMRFAEDYPNFSYKLCLSQERKEGCINGRVQNALEIDQLCEKTTYFLCGNPLMVDEVKSLLTESGVNRRSVRTESYVSPN